MVWLRCVCPSAVRKSPWPTCSTKKPTVAVSESGVGGVRTTKKHARNANLTYARDRRSGGASAHAVCRQNIAASSSFLLQPHAGIETRAAAPTRRSRWDRCPDGVKMPLFAIPFDAHAGPPHPMWLSISVKITWLTHQPTPTTWMQVHMGNLHRAVDVCAALSTTGWSVTRLAHVDGTVIEPAAVLCDCGLAQRHTVACFVRSC